MEVVTIGRVLVDLYANEFHRPLHEVESFSKYLGGSSGNMSVGLARLGHRCGFISRVGDDPHGKFLLSYLRDSGVDTRFVTVDPRYRTALAFAALFPPDDSEVIFYRDPCADTEVRLDDVDINVVCDASLLVVTGTTLARAPMRQTVLHLMTARRDLGRLNVMDIDHRPALWEDASEGTLYYGWALKLTDVLIGNEAEIVFAHRSMLRSQDTTPEATSKNSPDATPEATPKDSPDAKLHVGELERMAQDLVAGGISQVVVKLGPDGSLVATADGITRMPGFQVDVVNTLGAGDGFAAGYVSGLLRGWALDRCLQYGNAVGAIVVSRHGCAESIPTLDELERFLDEGGELPLEGGL